MRMCLQKSTLVHKIGEKRANYGYKVCGVKNVEISESFVQSSKKGSIWGSSPTRDFRQKWGFWTQFSGVFRSPNRLKITRNVKIVQKCAVLGGQKVASCRGFRGTAQKTAQI